MSDLAGRNMALLRQRYPEIAECLFDHERAINNLGKQVNAAPVGKVPPPPSHTALSVTGGGGKLDIAITSPSPAYPGQEHFADISPNASFSPFHTIHLGATTNWRGDSPVTGTAHIRTYSQYPTSDISTHLYASPVNTSNPTIAATQVGNSISGYGPQAVGQVKR